MYTVNISTKAITTNAKTHRDDVFMFARFMCSVEHIPGCKASRLQWKHGIPPIDLDHGHINASPKKAHQRTKEQGL